MAQGYTQAHRPVMPILARTESVLLLHDHLGPDRDAVVEVDDLVVDQPEAARRHRVPDGLGRIGAVNAVDRGAETERAGAERIAGAARYPARQVGVPADHLRRGRPVRPLLLARNSEQAGPLESVARGSDAVAHRPVV